MSRAFPLAGLLRLRGVQERVAAEHLTRAALEHAQTEARDRHLRSSLTSSADDPLDVRTLAAVAATRVAALSQLADLRTQQQAQAVAVEAARTAHADARIEEHGLRRLADGHHRREEARLLREEQATLDEIALRPRIREVS